MNPVYTIILVRTAQASILALALHWLLHWPLTGPNALGLYLCPLLCLYFVFVFVAQWSWGLPILNRLPTREKIIALTFDDGPSCENTPRILDILKRHQAKATFFVLGGNVRRYPDLLRRIVSEGHSVGIHGDTHTPFVLHSGSWVKQEITRSKEAIRSVSPEADEPHWLRPPHGFKDLASLTLAHRAGCRMAAWSLNSYDYQAQEPATLASSLVSRVSPGAIVLLHDGAGHQLTADALPQILIGIKAEGYSCVTL